MKLTKVLLIILFFTLPLIHGRIFPTLGLDVYFNISGNFEFTKTVFFNIFSGFIFLSFFIETTAASFLFQRKEFRMDSNYRILGIFLLILFLSTLFSVSPFTSLIGDLDKGHTALMYFNLLGLFIILKSLKREFIQKLIYISLLAGVFASLLAIKELYFPTYDYGALGDRALGSFGHPNYLAGYLLLLLPFLLYNPPTPLRFVFPLIKGDRAIEIIWGIKIIGTIIILFGIIFSQSIVAIVLAFGYLGFILIKNPPTQLCFVFPLIKGDRIIVKIWGIIGGISIFLLGVVLIAYFPEKLHSFLSRFYLWETTLRIIFSDIKIFLIGGGVETLPYYFDSFKVPQVYIFENYGFTADRPHNFILNIFYSFGVFALGLFLYGVYYFFKNFRNTSKNLALLLFLLFGIIHYFSIASYTLVILIISLYPHSKASFFKGSSAKQGRIKTQEGIINLCITLISLTGAYYSFKLYESEILYNQKKYVEASENFAHPKYLIKVSDYLSAKNLENITSQISYKNQITLLPEKQSLCNDLTSHYPSAENYIYCGNIFWDLEKRNLAKEYYNLGLKKLPNLWDDSSPYWDSYFVKNTITGNRFFSEKFGDIGGVLKKIKK